MTALDDLYPGYFKFLANFDLHAPPEVLSPYMSLAIIITTPFSVPDYMPDSVQSVSLHLELRQTLPMSHANISK